MFAGAPKPKAEPVAAEPAATENGASKVSTDMFRDYAFDPLTQRHSFEIHHLDLSIVNALRRILLSDIPILSVLANDVEVVRYTGPGHNEILQHRISMVPHHFSEEDTDSADVGDYAFLLHKTNTTSHKVAVYAHDFEMKHKERNAPVGRIFPANPISRNSVLLTYLRPNEEIHIKTKITRGTARTHGYGFSPVSLAVHSPMPDMRSLPPNAGPLERERTFLKNEYGEPTGFHFSIEIENGLSCRYLVDKAFGILADRVRAVIEGVQAEVPEAVTLAWADPKAPHQQAEFMLHGEDDTVGNLLQSLAFNRYVRQKERALDGRYELTFVGYCAPHPLEKKIAFRARMVTDDEGVDDKEAANNAPTIELGDYRTWFLETASTIVAHVEQVRASWVRFMDAAEKVAKKRGLAQP